MRKPIILGVRGLPAELVSQAEAGICIQPENEHELLEAVEKLRADPQLARSLGEAGYERIASPIPTIASRASTRIFSSVQAGEWQ